MAQPSLPPQPNQKSHGFNTDETPIQDKEIQQEQTGGTEESTESLLS
jgi:hypothetical protein